MPNISVAWSDQNGVLWLSIDGKQGNVPAASREEALKVIKSAQDGEIGNKDAQFLKGLIARTSLPTFGRKAVDKGQPQDADIVDSLRAAGVDNIEVRSGNVVAFAGKPIDPAIGRHIARMVRESDGALDKINWTPLANFLLRVGSMLPAHRDNLMRWLSANDFTLLSDGRILAYKSVSNDYRSAFQGRGSWIDAEGVEQDAPYEEHKYLFYRPGNTVYMRREDVDPNSNVHCSKGIHFGTQNYARTFSSRSVIVLVAPEDVVSVPTDCNGQKARAERVFVLCDWDRSQRIPVTSVTVEDEKDAPRIFSTVGGEKTPIENKEK